MFHCANCWFEHWRGRSLSDSQQSFKQRRLHVGTSVLIGGGPLRISEKYSRGRWHKWHKDNTQVVSFH